MIADEGAARAWLAALPQWDERAQARIGTLVELLCEENARQNLVSAASLGEVWRRHIADSAQLLAHVPRGTDVWLDLGTGAGFPGLVIAALEPDRPVRLVESRKRRIEWLRFVADRLGLGKVDIIGERLESVPTFPAAVISARAFAPLDRLLTLSARFSTSATMWLLPKGQSAQKELTELNGWSHRFHVEQSLTDPEAGVIIGTLVGHTGAGRKGRAS